MTDEKDKYGNLLPDHQRLTNFGKAIRKLSIDELPQLINVLKGDMSLVGPRPLLFKYISLFSKEQIRRHEVKPGITGWAQVNGRNSISWTRKFELDVEYVNQISLGLDIKILYFTILKVVKSEGVNQSEARPMEPFNGKN
jgi:lipopolysaccharide/colanic/teichoic acid biosynthesis glycosyltransferase